VVKATQVGYSTATAGWAIFKRCLIIPNHLVIILSRSERQSLELARKCKALVNAYEGIVAQLHENRSFHKTSIKQHEIEFPNGSRIIALAANPDTARGYTGDIVLDEFAFHQDAEAIYKAAYGRMTRPGYQMRVISTPNGSQGKFFELAKQMALDGGSRPTRQPVKLGPKSWSAHWCDVNLAKQEGFPIDLEELKAGCDEDTWLQEYLCNFLAGGLQFIPWELFQGCLEKGLVVGDTPTGRGLYAGWDVARNRDLSVVWFDELLGDVTWARAVLIMANVPTPDQTDRVGKLMGNVHRLCIDSTGMGLPIYETMNKLYPGKVESVSFSTQVKEVLATTMKRRMEEKKSRLPETIMRDDGRPDDEILWQNFRAVRKTVTSTGAIRFDATHDQQYGHADLWWAKCLSEQASGVPTYSYAQVMQGEAGPVAPPIMGGLFHKVL
jgi:phage FluMu gp28-like protein